MAASSIGRVCPKCWTWYVDGETVCPTCGVQLEAGDGPPSPASSPSTPAVIDPPSALTSWLRSLAAKGALGLAIIVAILTAIILQGTSHKAWSSDRSFMVMAPEGWTSAGWNQSAGPPAESAHLLYLSYLGKDGAWADIVVDRASVGLITPGHFDQLVTNRTGPVTCDSPMWSTSVGGAEALITTCATMDGSLEVVYIDRYNHQYVVTLRTENGHADRFRGDFQRILDSWGWYP
jgi:hypothetical protein